VSMSLCFGKLKSFFATSTPSRNKYSCIFLRSAFGISLDIDQYLNSKIVQWYKAHILAVAECFAVEEVVVRKKVRDKLEILVIQFVGTLVWSTRNMWLVH
jgi:hypothetical protein